MSKKKSLITILAVALICVISVAGTLAFLTAETNNPVVNTFTAAGGGKLIGDTGSFTLTEHEVEDADNDGVYTLGTATTDANDYVVIPGVNLPKDPFITITEKTSVPAYLFVEVVDDLTGSALSYVLDDCWSELTGVAGINGGKVYVYAANGTEVAVTDQTDLSNINILKDKQVVVANQNDLGIDDAGITLKFYGYLAQSAVTKDGATSTSPADVYDVCF